MKRLSRRSVLGGLTAASLMSGRRAGAAAAIHAGQVESSRGECFARIRAARRPLAPPAEVFVGDLVATGAEASLGLRLGSVTSVRLGPDAQLRIDRFIANAGGILELDQGAVLYDHDANDEEGNVTVRSPFGLIAVRGTRFFAGPSNGVFGVFVERGDVTVVGAFTAVHLTAGLGTNLLTPGAEPTTPTIWATKRIADALAQFRP